MCNLLCAWKLKESFTQSLFELEELYIPHLTKSPDSGFVFHSLQQLATQLIFLFDTELGGLNVQSDFFFQLVMLLLKKYLKKVYYHLTK